MLTKNFQQLSKSDAQIAGGKGASLGEMTNAGIPVPPGFVVLSDAFEQFLAETDLNVEIEAILKTVDNQKMHTVENASEEIQALILQAKMPEDIAKEIQENFKKLDAKFVAVRSSATAEDGAEAAWAGQLDSYLNTNQEALLRNVQKCWASLFTPRAIFYRFEKKLHKQKISVAVVVQKMIQSEISGIAFSVHPVTEDYNQMIIEAGFGLGEAIVSGSITPDAYVVSKNPRKIEDINISQQPKGLFRKKDGGNAWQDIPEKEGKKQKLSKKQILELSDLIIKIEDHYQFPVDIEWAYENKKFYIVQSRPITTLIKKLGDMPKKNVGSGSGILENNLGKKDGKVIGKLSDYQQMFKWQNSLPYLVTSLFLTYYKKLDVLILSDPKLWVAYLPLSKMEKTHQDGFKIYGDKKRYAEYRDDFKKYMENSEKFFKNVIHSKDLDKSQTREFLNRVAKLFSYYSKAEFFYTEKAYFEQENNLAIKENFATFEQLKIDGRKFLNKIFFEKDTYLLQLMNRLSEKFKISSDFLLTYNQQEILDLFEGGIVDEKIILQRKRAYISKGKKEGIASYHGTEAEKMIKEFNSEQSESGNVLKGQVANKGYAKGEARVFKFGLNDFHLLKEMIDSMKKGEILVAETTAPEIMVACQKASAIVTNQGGMMSHAAIISREIGIPCIVGTSIATEVIQNGDLVEVDANEGVVRILRRNSDEESGIVFNKKYERVFGGPNMSFLISDIITDVYAPKYGFVTMYKNSIWTCYMPIEEKNKTLAEGAELYENMEKYEEFRSEYLKFIDAYDKHFREIFNPNKVITKEIFEALIDLFKKAESYYAYTQYFYTDGISQANKEFEVEFGALKEKGRELLNRQYFSGNNYLNEVLEAVSKIIAIKKDELYNYAWQDISLLWNSNNAKKDIRKWETYVTYPINGSKSTAFESEALEIIDQFLSNHNDHREILSGTVANRGKVVGNAYVLDKGYDHRGIGKFIDEMEKGAILITETTSPEIMTACEKASAIVANQGGLMSHAAIVSRELDIPCIVGLEGATEIIKNGDLVEVDADNGIVRILEKAKNDEYFKFKFPAYRYFMANRLIPTFKYEGVYLWGEIFGEYSFDGIHRTCTNKNVLLEPGKKLFALLKKGDQKLEKELLALVNKIIPLARDLQEIILRDKLTGHVSNLNDFFPNYEKVFNKALAFGYPLDYAIDEYLKKDASLSENLQSPYSSFLMEEEYELYEIFSKKYKKPELGRALERHLAKYAWIKSDYQGENVLTIDDLYAKEARLMDTKQEKTKSVGGKISAPKNLQEWISLLIYLRDVRKKVGMIGVVLLDRYLKQECQRLKKDYLKARLLSVAEFEQYKNKKLPEYLDKRNERMSPDGIEIIPNEKWQKYPFNQEVVVDKEKLLTGVVANKGKVKGIARIIIGKHDFHKMGKGEIIVASMTRPEFMPILRKASAILTEQGGITCHAAIISRELGVPCIIGIENLTAALKDGDLVEVDADNGVVRILK